MDHRLLLNASALSPIMYSQYSRKISSKSTMDLTGEQLKKAETQLKRYLPSSLQVYGYLCFRNRSDQVRPDPVSVLVDRWPEFSVLICKPLCEQKGDLFKDILVFAKNNAILEETIRNSYVIDWTRNQFTSHGNFNSSGIRKMCRSMTIEDVSHLPPIDSSGISIGSLDESHVALVNGTWKFGQSEVAVRMIRNMIANFPSCCVLDAEAKPVSWILTYASGSMGMLYTLPEHRGKGYAKVLVSRLAKRLHSAGYPVYCFIEDENMVSYGLFKKLGFNEADPSYRESWFQFNDL